MDTYDTLKAYRATRSLLADHIRGERKMVRKYRAAIVAADADGAYLAKEWWQGALCVSEQTLRNLRYLSDTIRNRPITS